MCVHMCAVHTYALYMWKPEDNLRCCSSALSTVLLRQGLSQTGNSPSRLGSLASELRGSAYLCLFSLLELQEYPTILSSLCRF